MPCPDIARKPDFSEELLAKRSWCISLLVGLAIVSCLPALTLPFISDDFVQIPLAASYAACGWLPLLHKEVHYRRQPEAAEPHCFSLSYPNSAGQLTRVTKQISTGKHGLFY
jgi:hypothetical protein